MCDSPSPVLNPGRVSKLSSFPLAGGRRLAAMKLLGKELIAASVFDLDDIDALKMEQDENDQRKAPTVSERVALAEAIAERLQGRQGRPEKGGNISTINDDAGKTRDIAAAKSGLGSGKTLEAAQKVIERGTPGKELSSGAQMLVSSLKQLANGGEPTCKGCHTFTPGPMFKGVLAAALSSFRCLWASIARKFPLAHFTVAGGQPCPGFRTHRHG